MEHGEVLGMTGKKQQVIVHRIKGVENKKKTFWGGRM